MASYLYIYGRPLAFQNLAETENQCQAVEEALQESEEKLRVLLNSTHDLALLVDTDGTVLTVNTKAAESYGKNPEELIGENIYSLIMIPG
jgi:PAS domain-containing protein